MARWQQLKKKKPRGHASQGQGGTAKWKDWLEGLTPPRHAQHETDTFRFFRPASHLPAVAQY